ncbi:hypothetical protein J6590_065352 [Homalodisca vitripennis]|nr:hypothetical protein J6590_065352 [Homalodisca vitripennis]
MVSYNVVVGDTVTKVLVRMFGLSPTALLARRVFVVLLCAFTVVIPLCYSHGDTVTKMFGLSPTALLARRDFVVLLFAFTVVIPLCYSHGQLQCCGRRHCH